MSNYEVMKGRDGQGLIKSWTLGVPFESQARDQLKNIASLPFIHQWVAAMPDVHLGIGATVGSVIATKGAVIPAAVGVDIGCGMCAFRLSLKADQLPDSLTGVFNRLEQTIPVGQSEHGGVNHTRLFRNVSETVNGLTTIVRKHPGITRNNSESSTFVRMAKQMGTLGGGNHFVELCTDENDDVWVMLHSGSRGIGNLIGRYFIEQAKELMETMMIELPDNDLAYLPEKHPLYRDYIEGVTWAQQYAKDNREAMTVLAIEALRKELPEFTITQEAINCHHNYVEMENHYGANVLITRKGAVRARTSDLGIIPGSMGTRSYIVRGKGNRESFCSCSHGAGRVLSRGKAKELISTEQHERDTAGVVCRKDAGVLDESPKAYKDIDAVMAAQDDLVEIVHTLKQVVCLKG